MQNQYILIAEDSKTQAEILGFILKEAGYSIHTVSNGKAALDFARTNPPMLILSDVIMPGLDGYQLCMQLRSNPETDHIPIILITQLFDPEDVIRGLCSGANNFIIKPYDKTSLLSRIELTLKQASQNDVGGDIQITYRGKKYHIKSNRQDLLNFLLSIYETAVTRNLELQQTTERLNDLACHLELLVNERTSELQKASDTVEQLLIQKTDLITRIGHDLKTPLTPLVALLPLVLQQENDPELKEILNILVHDTQILKGLIDQVVKLSHLSQRTFSMDEEIVVIWEIIEKILDGYDFSLKQKKITVFNNIPPDCTIQISPFHAMTIFENLISNAIKYNNPEGEVIINGKKTDGFWKFSIKDTGIGLSREEQEKVFEEFYKADPARHDHSGHGLGLSIVFQIMGIYGGIINVESEGKGQGSVFTISFPDRNYQNQKCTTDQKRN